MTGYGYFDPGFVDPERAQFDAFKVLPRDTSINMLNLVRFRDFAEYPEGHALCDKGLSGAEAYALYGEESGPIFQRVGGTIIWRGTFDIMLTGPSEEKWDAVFVARYPNAGAFLEMITDAVYRQVVQHRQAAVATSRLIRCGEKSSQNGTFG